MHIPRQKAIREEARRLNVWLWNSREHLFLNPPSAEQLIPTPTDIIIRDYLGAQLEEPEEIPSSASVRQEIVSSETAGYLDREHGRIIIAQKFKPEWRRFTAAHEIGHWILHPAVKYHRDRPLEGGERARPSRAVEEQEADLFAAELLMPTKFLTKYFHQHFGGPVDGTEPSEELTFWLSAGLNQEVDIIELAQQGTKYRALLISQISAYKFGRFIPLAKRFGVSPTAMAIQLEYLGLVR